MNNDYRHHRQREPACASSGHQRRQQSHLMPEWGQKKAWAQLGAPGRGCGWAPSHEPRPSTSGDLGWGGGTPGDRCFPTQPSLRGHNRPEAGSLESAMEVEGDTWKGWMPLYWQARIFCPQVGLGTPTIHKVITFPQSNLWLKNMPAVHENTWTLRGFAFENCPCLLMKVKEESEKAGLKLNIKKP